MNITWRQASFAIMSTVALQSMPLGPFARPSARMRGGILISKQIQKDNENGKNGVLLEEFKAFGDADCDKCVALERNAFPVKVHAVRAVDSSNP